METEVIRIDRRVSGREEPFARPSETDSASAAVQRAVEVLGRGGLVAFPTETVYGVGARADISAAMDRLRRVKSRDADHAFTVHIGSPADASRYAPGLEGLAARFIRKAWPGPLTLLLGVDDPSSAPVMTGLDPSVTPTMYHEGTIGLRCPDESVAAAVLQGAGGPVVATSANPAGHPPPWTAEDALGELAGSIDLLVDTGRTKYAKPSTIVRISGSSYKLVREGVLDAGIVERLSTLVLLLVCTGNTCRSPMAAAFAQKMLAERLGCAVADLPRRGIEVQSAGTAGGAGGASPEAMTVMSRRGMDLSGHASAALTPQMIRQADYIFTMTRMHCDTIIHMVPSATDRVRMLLEQDEVRDPIGGSVDDYERCARKVEEGLHARLQEVIL